MPLEDGKVFRHIRPIVDQDIRLELADHGIQSLGLELLRVQEPVAVVPEDINLAIIAADLPDLSVEVLDVTLLSLPVRCATRVIRVMEVQEGLV